jgi:hypothetical protein
MYLTYESEMTQSGIDGYRFIVPRRLFDTSQPENCGFCHPPPYPYYPYPQQTKDCLPAGILDVSHCQPVSVSGVTVYPPIVVSNPHVLYADDSVINLINQNAPTVEADQTYIDIEPVRNFIIVRVVTGLLLSCCIFEIWECVGDETCLWYSEGCSGGRE